MPDIPTPTPSVAPVPSATPTTGVPAAPTGPHILIVEDERPLAHALELKFRHEGFQTTIAMDGEEALKVAVAGDFKVILLDLIMPRMDGFTFLQELRKQGSSCPTIILSNLGQDEDKERAKQLGGVGYFVKSNTPIMEIVKQVQSIISSSSASS
ncbi:MAG: response regulator [Candidatus Peregrinibacteria bacterium]